MAQQRDAFLSANNLPDEDRFTFQMLTSEILAGKNFSDPAMDERPANDLAIEVMIEITDAYLETLEPLIGFIPSEDRPDAVTINGQLLRGIPGAPVNIQLPTTTTDAALAQTEKHPSAIPFSHRRRILRRIRGLTTRHPRSESRFKG